MSDATIQRHDKGNRRFYTVDGDPAVEGLEMPSVTTILGVIAKPALIGWSNKEGRRAFRDYLTPYIGEKLTAEMLDEGEEKARKAPDATRDAAADRGTRAHMVIEAYLNGEMDKVMEMDEDVRPYFERFREWQRGTDIEITLTEQMVYHPDLHYAGSMDALGRRGKTVIALDWKTGDYWPEADLQVAAYAEAYSLVNDVVITEGWVVSLKDGFEAHKVPNLYGAWQGFQAALGLYNWQKERGK